MDKIKYYSFDMFDTLITRLLNEPGDLFSIIEEKYELPNFKKRDLKPKILQEKIQNMKT